MVDWVWALGSPDKMRSDLALAESSPLVLCSSVLLGRGFAADGGFSCHLALTYWLQHQQLIASLASARAVRRFA
jgi:hypothetical protein